MTELNPVMQQVIETINLRPGEWYQANWVAPISDIHTRYNDTDLNALDDTQVAHLNQIESAAEYCGTAMCIAGWATVLSGVGELVEIKDGKGRVIASKIVDPEHGIEYREREFVEIAKDALGLDYAQANQIFFATNIHDPQKMTNHIKAVVGGTCDHHYEADCTC